LSFRRKPDSSYFKTFWTPAFAGVTTIGTFYEIIKGEFEMREKLAARSQRSGLKKKKPWLRATIFPASKDPEFR